MRSCVLASLAIWTTLLLIALGAVLLAPPICLLIRSATRMPWPRLARYCIWGYGRAVAWLLGLFLTIRVHERPDFPQSLPRIFVFNHGSLLDLFLITLVAPPDSVCLARQWPFSVPLFGPVMRLGEYINVERQSGQELLERARTLLHKGISLGVFPEGTRTRTNTLGRFRSGAFKLSLETGVSIRPVSIIGTCSILPPGQWKLQRGEIHISVLEDISPVPYVVDMLGHLAMCRYTRKRMAIAGLSSPKTSCENGARNESHSDSCYDATDPDRHIRLLPHSGSPQHPLKQHPGHTG